MQKGNNDMELKAKTMSYGEVTERVKAITDTKKTFKVERFDEKLSDIDYFTHYGLQTMGKTVGFPAQFIEKLNETNAPLAKEVIEDRIRNYFANGSVPFYAREFLGQICGVVSRKYAYFDDDEVMDIISDSPLTKMAYLNNIITPERFHTRVMDLNDSFRIAGDDSDLFFCFFIDNSMVGRSSMRVQLGIYRLACTNGLIVPVRELIMCRQVHRGNKDISAEFNESIAFFTEKKETIKELVTKMSLEQASVLDLEDKFRKDYVAKKLNLNQTETEKVMQLFKDTYDGRTKWGFINAVTEFARDINDINRREYLEKAAFKAA